MIISQSLGKVNNPYNFFTQVPGCVLYLDARNPLNGTTPPANNAAVPNWYDLSQGNNYNQPNTSQYPTYATNYFNGAPGIVFADTANQGYRTGGIPILSSPTGSWTIYLVLDVLNNSAEQFIIDSEGNTSRFLIYIYNGNWIWNADGTIGAASTGKQVFVANMNVATSTITFYVNGVSIGSGAYAANAPGTFISLGIDFGNSFAPAHIVVGAHLWYNWSHDSTTQSYVEKQLGNIFGIAT